MNIAIFGGTFDPVHRGHIEIARQAANQFGLQRVLFIPTGRPPHRSKPPEAAYEDRFRMVELACRADERFLPSRLESPAEHEGPHYSVDTIRRIKDGFTVKKRLYFLIGTDAFAEIKQWRQWQEIAEMVEFIVVSRPGEEFDSGVTPAGAKVHRLTSVRVPISSTEIRTRLRAREGVAEWLAPEVAEHISEHRLYRAPL